MWLCWSRSHYCPPPGPKEAARTFLSWVVVVVEVVVTAVVGAVVHIIAHGEIYIYKLYDYTLAQILKLPKTQTIKNL